MNGTGRLCLFPPHFFLDSSPHHRGKNLFLVLQPLPSPAHLYFTLAADRLTSGREALSRAAYSLAAITLSLPLRGRESALMKISAQFFAKMLQRIHILKDLPHIYSPAAEFQSLIFLLWATMTISPYFQPHVRFQSRPGQQASHCIISQTLVTEDT